MVKIITSEINGKTPIEKCPWCGVTPDANQLSWGGFSIRCNNSACRIRPETGWFDSADEALTIWNTRKS
jgi:hypothetical protein